MNLMDFCHTLLIAFTSEFGLAIIVAVAGWVTSLITGYIVLKERLVKSEIKLDSVYDYIDSRNKMTESQIKDLQSDLIEFRELNKDYTKSLNESNIEIRELKIMLTVVNEKLQKLT